MSHTPGEHIHHLASSWEEARRNELAAMFPGFDVWTVRNATCRHTTWCARPKGHPVATINVDSADELQQALADALADADDPEVNA